MAIEETTKQPITDEIATAAKDIDIFAGWLKRLENPDPTLRTESQGKGLKLYDEVDRDPHAGSVLQTRYLSVVGKDWSIAPAIAGEAQGARRKAQGETQNQKIADFVSAALVNINFDQARMELLQGILYGFYVAEVIWTVRDGMIVPAKLRAKHPRRFSFSIDRELRLLTPSNMIEGEPVPDRKFIQFTYGSSDNPYGKGLGQKLWWPVWFKKNGIKFWLVFLEKFGMPTGVGKYPPGTEPAQQQALLDAIDAIHSETGVKIPDNMAIELLEATRTGTVTYESLCEYMDKQISKAVLGQTGTTEGTPGKLGNESTQDETKDDITEADADLLDECLNNTLIRWIVDYNFPGVTEYPKIQTRVEAEKDLKPLADRDMLLTRDIGLPVGKRYFYETYNIPEPEEGEDIVTPNKGIQQGSVPAGQFAETTNKYHNRFSQANADKLSQQGAIDGQEAISVLLAPVLTVIENAKSFEEIGEKIYGLYPDLDTREFQDLLAKAMFAAGLTGYAASKGEKI